jgi:hypothetical protein
MLRTLLVKETSLREGPMSSSVRRTLCLVRVVGTGIVCRRVAMNASKASMIRCHPNWWMLSQWGIISILCWKSAEDGRNLRGGEQRWEMNMKKTKIMWQIRRSKRFCCVSPPKGIWGCGVGIGFRVISPFPHDPKSILTNPSFFVMHNTVYAFEVLGVITNKLSVCFGGVRVRGNYAWIYFSITNWRAVFTGLKNLLICWVLRTGRTRSTHRPMRPWKKKVFKIKQWIKKIVLYCRAIYKNLP